MQEATLHGHTLLLGAFREVAVPEALCGFKSGGSAKGSVRRAQWGGPVQNLCGRLRHRATDQLQLLLVRQPW